MWSVPSSHSQNHRFLHCCKCSAKPCIQSEVGICLRGMRLAISWGLIAVGTPANTYKELSLHLIEEHKRNTQRGSCMVFIIFQVQRYISRWEKVCKKQASNYVFGGVTTSTFAKLIYGALSPRAFIFGTYPEKHLQDRQPCTEHQCRSAREIHSLRN